MHLRRPNLRVLALLILLAIVASWPTARHLASRVPGSDTWAYDEYTFIWSMWWLKFSALDLHSSIFFSQNIFYPLGMELILYSYNLMAAILALPLGVAINWPLASNVLILLNIVFSGFGAYLLALWSLHDLGAMTSTDEGRLDLVSHASVRRFAAILAGLIYAFASNRMIYLALGHYNIQSWVFLPYFVLYLLRTMRQPIWRNAAMAGLFGALNLLVDMQYGVFMAFLGLCLLLTRPMRQLIWGFGRRREHVRDGEGKDAWGVLRRWAALAVIGGVAVLLTLPYFWETVKSMLHARFLIKGWGDALKLSADLAGWFTPTALHPLWGTDWPARLRAVQEGAAPFNDVNTVFLGFVTVALALIGAAALWKRSRGWIAATILAAIFTLGPLLQIYGRILYDFDGLETSIPLPFILLHYIPFVKGNRTANRWSIVLMLALAVLAAWGAWWLLGKMNGEGAEGRGNERARGWLALGVTGLLAAGILVEHAAMPLPTTNARIPDAVQQLASLPDGAVWQIPMGWRNSFGVLGVERTQAQYWMTAHHKPIISGNTSRNPAIKFDYFARLPLVAAIVQAESGHPPDDDLLAAARDQADEVITLWGVRYLMLMPPVPGRLPYADTWQVSQQTALELIPHSAAPIIDDGDIQIYGVEPGAPLPLTLDFGARNTDLWRAEGWGLDEPDVGGANGVWATARRAHFLFRSEDATPRTLRFSIQPFTWPGAPDQYLTIQLNDQTVATTPVAPGWQTFEFEIAPRPGINHVWFRFMHVERPRDKLQQAMIGSTGVQSPVNIAVHAFDQAFITLTGAAGEATDASFGRRGYNVTVLDPKSGEILDEQGFDTVANAYEVERLTAYLDQISEGRIVILATREGAGEFVSPELATALGRLGSAVRSPADLAGRAHALVGVVGAGPGSAAETIDARDAYLEVSGDFRTLAAAFDWMEIQ
ncbi:MAG TPA: hypothetical protein EYH29_07075 [Caldilineales bacterium]|nr:hypothetical protein [Caldilineales bacterium]